jgi:hypothetical protein
VDRGGKLASRRWQADNQVVASILEAQIDFLGAQVHSLAGDDRGLAQITEAVAVSLSLFDQIILTAERTPARSSETLFEHWLQSAQMILPPLRELKRSGQCLPELDRFMRSILKARAIMTSSCMPVGTAGRVSLDEVERELQRRAQ